MKIQKFIDILDEYGRVAIEFFKKTGKDIFTNDHLLLALMEEKWSRKKILKLFRLGWIIDMEIDTQCRKEKTHFDNILPIYRYFADYMNCGCAFFGDKRIPWEEWEDLAKEQVDLLQTLVEENKLEKFEDDKRYHAFCDKYEQREEELVKKGYNQLWDGEYV